MVYDNTQGKPHFTGTSGYTIHKAEELSSPTITVYELYTDDGKGNGDYVCQSCELYWIRRIAHSLDAISAREFNYQGEPVEPRRGERDND